MHYILNDTCIWLDLIIEPGGDQLLDAMESLAASHKLILLIPSIIAEEFERNQEKAVNRKTGSIKAHLKESISALKKFGDQSSHEAAVVSLETLYADIERLRKSASTSVDKIRGLFARSSTIRPTHTHKHLALSAERGLQARAPFVRGKNSVADAVILEIFREETARANSNSVFGFVTTNSSDFCDPINKRNPHPDIAGLFRESNVFFETNIALALNKVQNALVPDELVKRVTEFTDQLMTDTCPNCDFRPMASVGKRPSPFGEYWSLFLQCPRCLFQVDTGVL